MRFLFARPSNKNNPIEFDEGANRARIQGGRNRIPTLDGWRAIAILTVLVSHAQFGMNGTWFGGHSWIVLWGRHGVDLFFVLSGYLITDRLLCEERINLRSFYTRRFFRLMPAAWTYLAVIIAVTAICKVHVSRVGLLGCLLFFSNYLGDQANISLLRHFWSLSIEEQFYLVWPLLLLLLGRKRGLILACFAFAALSIYDLLNRQVYLAYLDTSMRTEFNAHGILAGCILALTLKKLKTWVARHAGLLLVISVAGVVWNIQHYFSPTPLESIFFAVMIASTSMSPSRCFSRALQWSPLAYVGTISYSLYIWQEMLLMPHLKWLGAIMVFPIAVLSYAFIEQPSQKFGKRFVGTSATALARTKPMGSPESPEKTVEICKTWAEIVPALQPITPANPSIPSRISVPN